MLKFGMNKCQDLLFQAFFSELDYVDLFMIHVIIFCLIWKKSYWTFVVVIGTFDLISTFAYIAASTHAKMKEILVSFPKSTLKFLSKPGHMFPFREIQMKTNCKILTATQEPPFDSPSTPNKTRPTTSMVVIGTEFNVVFSFVWKNMYFQKNIQAKYKGSDVFKLCCSYEVSTKEKT